MEENHRWQEVLDCHPLWFVLSPLSAIVVVAPVRSAFFGRGPSSRRAILFVDPRTGAYGMTVKRDRDDQMSRPDNRLKDEKSVERTPGLKLNADGGITIFLQNNSSGKDNESDWLPTPRDEFFLTLRAYTPREAIIAQSCRPPGVTALTG